jgi:hypothetical protein
MDRVRRAQKALDVGARAKDDHALPRPGALDPREDTGELVTPVPPERQRLARAEVLDAVRGRSSRARPSQRSRRLATGATQRSGGGSSTMTGRTMRSAPRSSSRSSRRRSRPCRSAQPGEHAATPPEAARSSRGARRRDRDARPAGRACRRAHARASSSPARPVPAISIRRTMSEPKASVRRGSRTSTRAQTCRQACRGSAAGDMSFPCAPISPCGASG